MKGSGYETSLTLLRDYSLFIAGGGGGEEDFKDYMVFRENVWELSVANRV